MRAATQCDLAIVGGGLAGGLVAYALSVRRPDVSVKLIEPDARFGGNHVWSFFTHDVAPEDAWIVDPFVDHRWDAYEVRFPTHRRRFDMGYNSIRSERFDTRLHDLLGPATPLAGRAVDVARGRVTLDDQSVIESGGVIDARGASSADLLDCGWQKFVGQTLRLAEPHGLTAPIIMDATVEQRDGFRFVYVLPVGVDTVFVEDTYYSDGDAVDRDTLSDRIAGYARASGWTVVEVLSEESGALPVAMGGDFEGYWQSGGEAGKVGMRAAMFQAATGYSLPLAVRAAAEIVRMPDLSGDVLAHALHDLAEREWRGGSYYRLLNRLAFRAAQPETRYRIYQRFYRLRAPLIARFYAGKSTPYDKLRILAGKPPVPIGRALRVLKET